MSNPKGFQTIDELQLLDVVNDGDAELNTIRILLGVLETMPMEARWRMLAYLANRLGMPREQQKEAGLIR